MYIHICSIGIKCRYLALRLALGCSSFFYSTLLMRWGQMRVLGLVDAMGPHEGVEVQLKEHYINEQYSKRRSEQRRDDKREERREKCIQVCERDSRLPCMVLRISSSLPITGSSLPCLASLVRSVQNLANHSPFCCTTLLGLTHALPSLGILFWFLFDRSNRMLWRREEKRKIYQCCQLQLIISLLLHQTVLEVAQSLLSSSKK